jgi:ADP-ribose pyrophosphatase YjhB (NUDIX family)/SAM-dependent methyltransferase
MAEHGRYVYEWPRPMVTVDACVFAQTRPTPKLLLIKRGREPFKHKWAFPGGFVEMDEELGDAAARELEEETGLTGADLRQMHTFGTIGRDPRGRTITIAFIGVTTVDNMKLKEGDDAAEAAWFDIDALPDMAFDHRQVAEAAIKMYKQNMQFEGECNVNEEFPITHLVWAYRSSRVLQVANKIDLFSKLGEEGLSLEQVCNACRTRPGMTEKLLVACAALGFIERDGPLYRNSDMARTYLVRSSPQYQGDIIAHSDVVRGFWDRLEEEICLEPPRTDEAAVHRSFIMGMHNITMAGRGRIFEQHIDLTGRRRLLDVGGGPGTYSILACKAHPQLTAVIFDLPATIAIARQVVEKEGLSDRISFHEGDWEKDSFGEGFDAVLMSNIMHGPDSMAAMKLRKAFDAMLPGGMLMVQEFLLNDDKTGPLATALFNMMVGAYSTQELLAEIRQAGFSDEKLIFNDEKVGAGWITARKS